MEKEAFEILKNIEDTWWHCGRTEAIRVALSAVGIKTRVGNVLDVGAGYGGMFEFLLSYGPVSGTEPDTKAQEACLSRGYRTFFSSPKEAYQSGERYTFVGAFDVIEHVDSDLTFVKELFSLTEVGGYIVATVPAFQFLWSAHDVTHMHYRRHTVGSMKKLLQSAGYEVVYARYWNTFLFPLVVATRLMGFSGEGGLHPHPLVNQLLTGLLTFEATFLRYVPIPFGLSVTIVGKKIK